MKPDFGDRPRCFQPDVKLATPCPEEFVVNPDNEQIIMQDWALSRGGTQSSSGGGRVSGGSIDEQESGGSSMSGGSQSSGGSSMSGGGHGSAGGRIVQVSPQIAKLKLRVGEFYWKIFHPHEAELTFTILDEKHLMRVDYSQAVDYPVDLYYLMDLSKSMEDDKEKLSHLGDLLSDTMRNITSNFRLGFGSFVDKVLMPYVSTVPKK